MTPGTAFSGFSLSPSRSFGPGQARRNGAAHGVTAASDFAGLEHFAYVLFCWAAEESAESPGAAGRARTRLETAALDPRRVASDTPARPDRNIPLAYQLWLAYLFWLEEVVRALDCCPRDISSVELAGLQAVARARARFLRTHQVCPRCEALNSRTTAATGGTARCRRCLQEL